LTQEFVYCPIVNLVGRFKSLDKIIFQITNRWAVQSQCW